MNKYLILVLLFFFIYGCSDPQPCPELDFDTNEGLTYVNSEPCLADTTYKNENKRSIQQYLNGADHGKYILFENGKVETKGKFNNGSGLEHGITIGLMERVDKSQYTQLQERKKLEVFTIQSEI